MDDETTRTLLIDRAMEVVCLGADSLSRSVMCSFSIEEMDLFLDLCLAVAG